MTASITCLNTAPRISTLIDAFSEAAPGQRLRLSPQGLHTHARFDPSKNDFLAKFRDSEALAMLDAFHTGGTSCARQAIDREFGDGAATKVFAAMARPVDDENDRRGVEVRD